MCGPANLLSTRAAIAFFHHSATEETMRPSKRAILASLTGIASFFFTFLFFLSKYYMRVMPSVPQPADGHVYPYDEHGWIVYLTWGEKLLIDVAIAVSFVSTAVLVMFGFFFVRDVSANARD